MQEENEVLTNAPACDEDYVEQSAQDVVNDEAFSGSEDKKWQDGVNAEVLLSAYKSALLDAKNKSDELEAVKKNSTPEKLLENAEFLDKVVKNPVVKEKIIENYLKSLSDGTNAPLLGGTGVAVGAPALRATTLKEAKRLADLLMNE